MRAGAQRPREAAVTADALARQYGAALHTADIADAERVVDAALEAGLTPTEIQSLVIAPALTRIGEQWETGAITVADEHLATAVSQAVLVKLFARLTVARARSRERVLLAAVQGQHHVLGLRMIADVLEGAGFDVLYLGADVPIDALKRFVADHQPALTGLAFGIDTGEALLAEAIAAAQDECSATQIVLGGRAVPAGLLEAGYAHVANSLEVLDVVERLLRAPAMPAPGALERLRAPRDEPGRRHERRSSSDPVAERMAEVAQDTAAMAREYVRLAGAYKDLAFRDPVTDLGNRRAFDDRMHTSARVPEGPGALLMIDIDAFKAVNDNHGHAAGDRLLRAIGTTIAHETRGNDFTARVGGDEFAVLLPHATRDEAHEVGLRIRRAVAADAELPVTVSIGVAPLGADVRATVLAADVALYEAKAAGRDRIIDAAGPIRRAATGQGS
jgi:diguanylate cyclase (GGDEF)-like protein